LKFAIENGRISLVAEGELNLQINTLLINMKASVMYSSWRYDINASLKSSLFLSACTNMQRYVLLDVHILGWTKTKYRIT